MQTEEVKPVTCGCGGEAFTHILGNEIAKGYYIACDECGTKTKVFGYEAEAVEAWNRAMGVDRGFDEWCTNCKEYDHDKHCCPRWNRVIRYVVNEVREKYDERTAKVKENATRLYCGECGERLDDYDDICGEPPIKYCPNCGARLEWK